MSITLIQMALIMACGTGWRYLKPSGLSAEYTRTVLTTVVYYLFLPAMVLDVLWTAEIGIQSFELSLLGMAVVLSGLAVSWLCCSLLKFNNPQKGAVMLAASFPNVTYLGLPVLEQTFGSWARSVAIQLDFFAAGPLLFTVGIATARYYGHDESKPRFILSFLNTPPFWVALVAVLLNQNAVDVPFWLSGILQMMSAAVVPLMLFSLGLALKWQSIQLKNFPFILPVVVIRLALIPGLIILVLPYMTLDPAYKLAAQLDLSMPSMVLGIVFCDRYRLDSALYAMAVTVTTLVSLFSLPFWYEMTGTLL